MASEQSDGPPLKPGDRVRVMAVGPLDAYRRRGYVVGIIGTLSMVAPAIRGAEHGWLGADLIDAPPDGSWCFLQCKLERVE